MDWTIDWLIGWLVDCSMDWTIDWLIGWLVDCSMDWTIDWLIGWLFKKYFHRNWLFFKLNHCRNRIYGSEERIHSAKLNESEGKENSLLKAEAHKARLLEFDRTAAQRTKIIDDQADYYNENAFMTAEQRIAIREKEKELRAVRFASRKEKNRKFDLDIAGRAFKSQADEISDMYGDPGKKKNQFNFMNIPHIP